MSTVKHVLAVPWMRSLPGPQNSWDGPDMSHHFQRVILVIPFSEFYLVIYIYIYLLFLVLSHPRFFFQRTHGLSTWALRKVSNVDIANPMFGSEVFRPKLEAFMLIFRGATQPGPPGWAQSFPSIFPYVFPTYFQYFSHQHGVCLASPPSFSALKDQIFSCPEPLGDSAQHHMKQLQAHKVQMFWVPS